MEEVKTVQSARATQTKTVVPGSENYLLKVPEPALQLLPAVVKDRNWNPIQKYGAGVTKKDIKVRAKMEWGAKVAGHLKSIGMEIPSGKVANDEITQKFFASGALVGAKLKAFLTKLNQLHLQFINKPLAEAYMKYNFYYFKYNKKKYVENPVGMQLLSSFNDKVGNGGAEAVAELKKVWYATGNAKVAQLTEGSNAGVKILGLTSKYYQYTVKSKGGSFGTFDTAVEGIINTIEADLQVYVGAIRLSVEYERNKHIANKVLFAQLRGYDTLMMQYGLVVSNHSFDTLYVICIADKETTNKVMPIYALTHGSRVNIPKTILDFNDHVLFLGVTKPTAFESFSDDPQNALMGITTYLKYSSFQRITTGKIKKYENGQKLQKPRLSQYVQPGATTLIGTTTAKNGKVGITALGGIDIKADEFKYIPDKFQSYTRPYDSSEYTTDASLGLKGRQVLETMTALGTGRISRTIAQQSLNSLLGSRPLAKDTLGKLVRNGTIDISDSREIANMLNL